jgi:predicted phage-related endonuclease
MQVHNVTQGSPEWHALRARHFCASEAPAMMGCSPYLARTALLQQKKTGVAPEVDAGTQRRFDDGHAAEATYRGIAEQVIGDDLFPVTGSRDVDGLPLLASFDGLTMDWQTGYEHKLYNADTVGYMLDHDEPPMHHVWQLEHQLLVAGATRILFACSNGAAGQHCFYESKPERRERLLAGWRQFAADLADYVPPEIVEPVTPTHVESLPAVSVRVEGSLAVISNLDAFGTRLRAFIDSVPTKPSTDQEFADAENACKVLQKAQDALEQAEAAALSQTADIEQMRRTVADYAGLARNTRLMLEKVVKARKEQVRVEIVTEGQTTLQQHVAALNARLGKPYMPSIPADFGGAIKGKKTLASIREAVNVVLTNAKLQANEIADRIQVNLAALREHASGHAFLFPDTAAIVQKAPDDLLALVKSRISDHQAAEARRLEAERERIRQEEQQRAQRELEQRQAAERAAAAAAATPAPAPAPAPSPAPAPATAPTLVNSAPVEPTAPARLMKLGDITAAIGLPLTADVLADLGFLPASTERGAKLYRAADFPMICSALVARINAAAAAFKEAA